MKKIGIIGFGWLGEPLGHQLKEAGYIVVGSCTSETKKERLWADGLHAVNFKLSPYPEGVAYQALFQVDVLVVNVPPRSRSMPGDFYPEQMRYLREMIEQAGIKHVIFASSTSVYPNERQLARESDALLLETSESPGILAAEYHMQGGDFNCTVLRFGGLLGVNRVPGSYFSGKEGVAGNPPVNYIHQEDAIRLIQWVIEEGKWNEVYNAVSPLHPCRREVYEENARRMGFAPPASYAETAAWKTISADKLVEHGFEFVFQDPMKFWYQKV